MNQKVRRSLEIQIQQRSIREIERRSNSSRKFGTGLTGVSAIDVLLWQSQKIMSNESING